MYVVKPAEVKRNISSLQNKHSAPRVFMFCKKQNEVYNDKKKTTTFSKEPCII